MSRNRVRAATAFAFLALVAECFGQICNSHPLRPSLLPPCPTVGSRLADAVTQAADINKRVAQANAEIDGARRAFWKAFPDGPGYAAAEAAFSNELWQKDEYYLMISYPQGVTGDAARMMNVIAYKPVMTLAEYQRNLHSDPKNMDGGINPAAYPLFVEWVNALRREGGAQKDGQMANPMLFAKVFADRSNRRLAYEQARNWAEFEASGLDLAKYLTPKIYIQVLMATRVNTQLSRAKTADVPDGQAATLALYEVLIKNMGEQEVLAAATAVLRAPRNPVGGLAAPFPVDIGSDVREASTDPFLRFLSLLTEKNPRNYAIALSLDPYALLGSGYASQENWTAAMAQYNRLLAKYGEPAVLAAAAKLKAVQKAPTGGIRGDPQAKPLAAWFQAALDDPKTVIPDGRLPHFKASSYNPRWRGKYLAVRGTVSRVEVDQSGRPLYATIHFKESSVQGIMGYSPYSSMLQSEYGKDFSGLVGRPVEIWGNVGDWREGAGVRILDLSQVKVLESGFGSGPEAQDSQPEWMTAVQPVEVLADSPKYLAWKKFSPGAKATYIKRMLYETGPGTNQYTRRSKIARITFQLESIDQTRNPAPDESGDEILEINGRKIGTAVVRVDETVWHMNGQVSNSAPNKLIFKAKEAPPVSPVHWQSVWARASPVPPNPDPDAFLKTWTSDEVPGGLVLLHDQTHQEILKGQRYRSIWETILEPMEGVDPELGSANASPQAQNVRQSLPPGSSNIQPGVNGTAPSTAGAAPAIPDLNLRYAALSNRSLQARLAVTRIEQQQGGYRPPGSAVSTENRRTVPGDVRDARTRLDSQLQAARGFLNRGDTVRADESLRSAESALATIEKFLGR